MPPPLVLGAGGPRLQCAAVGALPHSGCDFWLLLLVLLVLLRLLLRLPLLPQEGCPRLTEAGLAHPLLPCGGVAVPACRFGAAFAGAAALQALALLGLLLRLLLLALLFSLRLLFLWIHLALHLLLRLLLRLPLLPLQGCPRAAETGLAQPLLPCGRVAVPPCRLGATFAGAAALQALPLRWLLLLLLLIIIFMLLIGLLLLRGQKLWQLAVVRVGKAAAGATQLCLARGVSPP